MKTLLRILAISLSVTPLVGYAQTTAPATAPAPHKKVVHNAASTDPGDRAFQANCARCHSAPEEIRPSIAGTVVMHMRVRANLSAKDEALLMKYFAQ